ncbi:MAG: NAD(P)H-dependent oxidoreductase subunit E [Moorellales bacterium]
MTTGEAEELQVEALLQRCRDKGWVEKYHLIPLLQKVQAGLGYLPPHALRRLASLLNLPEVEVYAVASFYHQFRLHPPGEHQIKVCMGTACHLMGGQRILDWFQRRLGVAEGETTPDRRFTLERVACVGCCALAPVVVVDEKVEGKVSPTRADGILLSLGIKPEAMQGKEGEPANPGPEVARKGRRE